MSSQSDAPSPPNGLTSKGARTRRAILDAAAKIFVERDISTVKVEHIAEAAGVSVGTLYKHFASKQGIVLAFADDGLEIMEGYMAEARALTDPLERVYAAGDAYVRFAEEYPDMLRFALVRVMQPDRSPELADVHQQLSARTQRMVLGIATDLKDAMRTGKTAPAPMEERMLVLWALWSGMTALMVRQDGTAISADSARRALSHARDQLRRAALHAVEHPDG